MRAHNQAKMAQFYALVRGAAKQAFEDGLRNQPKRVYGDRAVGMYAKALIEIEEFERRIIDARVQYICKRTREEFDKRGIYVQWTNSELEALDRQLKQEADDMGLLVPRSPVADTSYRQGATTTHEV